MVPYALCRTKQTPYAGGTQIILVRQCMPTYAHEQYLPHSLTFVKLITEPQDALRSTEYDTRFTFTYNFCSKQLPLLYLSITLQILSFVLFLLLYFALFVLCFLYCSVYVYLFLFVLSVLV